MPTRTFAITADDKPVSLDNTGAGEVTISVSNTTARSIRGQAKLVAVSPAKVEWLSLSGEVERAFAANEAQQFVVRVRVPSETAPGKHMFRLNVFSVANPDSDFTEGPVVAFQVPTPTPPPAPKRGFNWFYVILALIVVGAGIAVAMLLRGEKMPDLQNLSEQDATNRITNLQLVLGEIVRTNAGTIVPGHVIDQEPDPGTTVRKGDRVVLVIRDWPRVPPVTGKTLIEAVDLIRNAGLAANPVAKQAPTTDARLDLTVKEATPKPGSTLNPGEVVTLTIWKRQERQPDRPITSPPLHFFLTNALIQEVKPKPRPYIRFLKPKP